MFESRDVNGNNSPHSLQIPCSRLEFFLPRILDWVKEKIPFFLFATSQCILQSVSKRDDCTIGPSLISHHRANILKDRDDESSLRHFFLFTAISRPQPIITRLTLSIVEILPNHLKRTNERGQIL